MEHTLISLLTKIAFGVDVLGCLIMLWGFALCFFSFLSLELKRVHGKDFITQMARIRFKLGTYLLLGLEFMIAGDIIHTVLDPTVKDIILISVIVVIRTTISYFLGKEIEGMEKIIVEKEK